MLHVYPALQQKAAPQFCLFFMHERPQPAIRNTDVEPYFPYGVRGPATIPAYS